MKNTTRPEINRETWGRMRKLMKQTGLFGKIRIGDY